MWDKLNKISIVSGIVSFLILIILLLAPKVREIIGIIIPFWIFVPSIIIAFTLGLNLARLLGLPSGHNYKRKANRVGLMLFNYESARPEYHHWDINPHRGSPGFPILESIVDGTHGRVLKITRKNEYTMYYKFSQDETCARSARITLLPGPEWWISFRIGVTDSTQSTSKEFWLSTRFGQKDPPMFKDSRTEWKFYLPKIESKNEWTILHADLMDLTKETFGQQGWTYQKLIGIQLRGDMTIAQIELLK